MAQVIRDKFDLFTLCCKGEIIGTAIQLEDDTFVTISDWYADYKTGEIHLEFEDDENGDPVQGDSFDLGDKFIVRIADTYKKVPSQKKTRNRKKKQ